MDAIPCGCTAALTGLDNFINKTATITTLETSQTIKGMKFTVAPVVRVAVRPKNAQDLQKLIDGLKKLSQQDPLVEISIEESTGEYIIAGSGELHIEICLSLLQKEYANGIEITTSEPIVSYKETVTAESSQTCLAKSANKLNRLFARMQPLSQEEVAGLENNFKFDQKEIVKTFNE